MSAHPTTTPDKRPARHESPEIDRDFLSFQTGKSGTLEIVTIVDVFPHTNCYRVMRGGKTSCAAFPLSCTSYSTVQGTNEITSYQIDTQVLAFYPTGSDAAFILGAVPQPIYDGNLAIPPVIVPGSDIGITDTMFSPIINSSVNSGRGLGLQNRSGGKPTDSLPGDWGAMNELGVGILVSKLLAMVRAAPDCGLYAFYLDNLLRLHAYNHELFTSSTEQRIYNDEGEVHNVEYGVKFPWEALGISASGASPFKNDNSKGWKPGVTDASYEPLKKDQTGLWREVRMRGYLGDLYRHTVILPNSKAYEKSPVSYSDNKEGITQGLSEITEGADGRIGIRSAKEILLTKYALIPAPQQVALPDDPKADWTENYKASGELGKGDAPPEQKDFTWEGEATAGDLRASYLTEYLAYTFNWYKVQNIVAHKKDWKLPEESKPLSDFKVKSTVIQSSALSDLSSKFWAGVPKNHDVKIDSRMKSVKYYESMSAFAMLDDGTVILEDGWGSSIVMSRGNIQLCAAGDVLLRPGRSVHTLAPKDITLRAGGSIDLTATTKDVRIKAEANLQLLAGNDSDNSPKKGGILLESRSASMQMEFTEDGEEVVSGGVVIKCRNSDFAAWANNIYIATKQMDTKPAGQIMMSADKGDKDIVLQANNHYRDIKGFAVDQFSKTARNVYTEAYTVFDTNMVTVKGNLGTLKGGIFSDTVLASNKGVYSGGNIISAASVAYGGKVAMMLPGGGKVAEEVTPPIIEQMTALANGAKEATGNNMQKVIDLFQSADKIGNDAVIKKVQFSMRTDKNYACPDFKLHAARWQQLCKDLGVSTHKWKERPVKAANRGYRFAGSKAYTGSDKFVDDLQFKMFKAKEGYAADRGEKGDAYKEAKNQTPGSGKSLNEYQAMVPVE